MCIASSRAAALRWMAGLGRLAPQLPVRGARAPQVFRGKFCAGTPTTLHQGQAAVSRPAWRAGRPRRSRHCSRQATRQAGSSTANAPLPARNKCWPTSRATLTGSPSATAGFWPWTRQPKGNLRLEGLRRRSPAQDHDLAAQRVRAPVLPAPVAAALRENPPLRLAGQPWPPSPAARARALLQAQSPAGQPLPELQPTPLISPTLPVCPHCGWAALRTGPHCAAVTLASPPTLGHLMTPSPPSSTFPSQRQAASRCRLRDTFSLPRPQGGLN